MKLLFDSCRGTSIPHAFASEIVRECVFGVDEETYATLAKGDTAENEWYWEAWSDVTDHAILVEDCDDDVLLVARDADLQGDADKRDMVLKDAGAEVYRLEQTDGDVWMIPLAMEWCDETEQWCYPDDPARIDTLVDRVRSRMEVEVTCDVDDTPIRGNALASGDEIEDANQEQWVRDQLANGNEWTWGFVTVTGTWRGRTASDSLGACSYHTKSDFLACGYYEDMCDNVARQIANQIIGDKQ
jgi:hypothetical protein